MHFFFSFFWREMPKISMKFQWTIPFYSSNQRNYVVRPVYTRNVIFEEGASNENRINDT